MRIFLQIMMDVAALKLNDFEPQSHILMTEHLSCVASFEINNYTVISVTFCCSRDKTKQPS